MTRAVLAWADGGPEVLAIQHIVLPAPVGTEVAGEAAEAHRHLPAGHTRGNVVPVP